MTDEDEIGTIAYFNARDRLAADVRRGDVSSTPSETVAHVACCGGFPPHEAAEIVERFQAGIVRDLARHTTDRGHA